MTKIKGTIRALTFSDGATEVESSTSKYAFVFSSDLEDWIVSSHYRKTKHDREVKRVKYAQIKEMKRRGQ